MVTTIERCARNRVKYNQRPNPVIYDKGRSQLMREEANQGLVYGNLRTAFTGGDDANS
jgi:hypothetical protein